jgi:hypothetical protein
MASTNMELVRSISALWEPGDYRSADWAHPEIEYVIPDGPAPGSWSGPAAMSEGHVDLLGAWADHRTLVEGYLELDDERVLIVQRIAGRGRRSGVELGDLVERSRELATA